MEKKIITDKLVFSKTNKTIEDWFKILDKKGAKKMNSAEIFILISNIDGLKPLGEWNQNLLSTTYQWSRKLKERGEKKNGFEISVSKIFNVPIKQLYNSWIDDKIREKWLKKEKIIIRKSTENKSARITWSDNETSLSVDFYPKGENISQVVVQHLKIKDSTNAFKMKEYWKLALDELKTVID